MLEDFTLTTRFLSCAESFAQGRVNLYSLGAADKSLLPEPLHERIDSRTCGPHHFRQDFVREVRNLNVRPAVLTQVREPQKHVRQPLFRGGGQQVRDMIPIVLDVGK